MQVSLTLNFDSLAKMEEFLNSITPVAAVAIASASIADTAVPLKVVPDTTVEIDPLATADAVADPDLRATLLARLRVIAAGMEDATVLGTFITGFGVTKFSDIADEDLPAFETALNKKFKA